MSTPTDDSSRLALKVAVAWMVCGAALRLWQYVGHTSLWVDEAMLAENILDLPLRDLLTGPLRMQQVAPKGFLLLVRLSVLVFGRSDFALRFVPLASSIAAMTLVWLVARRTLRAWPATIAVALFAMAPGASFFVQVKQYSTDAFAAGLALLASFDVLEGRRERSWAAIGMLLPWLSLPVAFVLAGTGIVLVLHDRRRWPIVSLWAAGVLSAGWFLARTVNPDASAYLHSFWLHGFAPLDSGIVRWICRLPLEMAGPVLRLPLKLACAGMAMVGAIAIARHVWRGALVLAPLLVALAASTLRVYPLADRLLWFATPAFVILAAAGAAWFAEWIRVPAAVALAIIPAALSAGNHPVHRFEDIRPALAYIDEQCTTGDTLYVFWNAGAAYRHYQPSYQRCTLDIVMGESFTPRTPDNAANVVAHRDRTFVLFSNDKESEREQILVALDRAADRLSGRSFGGDNPASVYVFARRFFRDIPPARREGGQREKDSQSLRHGAPRRLHRRRACFRRSAIVRRG